MPIRPRLRLHWLTPLVLIGADVDARVGLRLGCDGGVGGDTTGVLVEQDVTRVLNELHRIESSGYEPLLRRLR